MILFKVDFENAFDYVSWRTSILIYGSLTSEFPLKRGLRQGDPLSPFLFIIVMDGLHMALNDGLAANMFHVITVGSPGMHLSQLFYANDVIVLSERNLNDVENIMRILNIFYIASGLKISIYKSNGYGVGVSFNEVEIMAFYMGCEVASIDRFKARLSGWSANLLSIGGRLTLIKSMLGSLGIYYLSIFKVLEMVVKSLESLHTSFFWGSFEDYMKLAWVKCPNALWVHVVKAIHGDEACIDIRGCHTNGVWAGIVGSILHLHSSGIVPLNSIHFKVGDGSSIRFWKDTWIEESIDSGFARFNNIITSLKAFDESFSSKNYVRKFFRALHPKWRAKVTPIEELKDLSSLALDELIGNLKVHEVVMEKDSEIYRGKMKRVKSIALKAKKESSDDETLTSGSDDEEYSMAVRNFKTFFRRKGKFVRQPREEKNSFRQRDEKKGKSDWKCFRYGDPNHLISDCPKLSLNKDQKAFIGGSWSDSENDAEDKTNDETCLMAQSSNEITLNYYYYSDDTSSLDNDKLNEKIKKLERSKNIEIACKSCEELKSENAKLKETQVKFVQFDKSANSLREMLNNQKSPSCKIGLEFDYSKVSTCGTKNMSFFGSSAEKATEKSTIKLHGSTLPGSVSRTYGEKGTEHVFSSPMSSRSDFIITRKKLIHNSIDESKKSSLKPSHKAI
nr:reverse transcriptase domain, reverse transcriptase zinc-binding domain protein [Tanacetum cinerariifolium]